MPKVDSTVISKRKHIHVPKESRPGELVAARTGGV